MTETDNDYEKKAKRDMPNTGGHSMKALVTIASFLLCVGVLLFSVNFVAYNKNFYDAQFKANDVAETVQDYGVSVGELNEARDKIIDYLSGKTKTLDIDFFTDLEKSHMKDAKDIFGIVNVIAYILLIIGGGAIIAFLFIWKKRFLKNIAIGGCVFLGLLGLIGFMILLDFNWIFTLFHEVAFPQGNWQFDSSSLMLMMLPESLFTSAALIIAGVGVAFAAVLTLTCFILNANLKNRFNTK